MEEQRRFDLINVVRLAKGKYMPLMRNDDSFTDEMLLERLAKCFEVDGYPYIKHPKSMAEMLLSRCFNHGLYTNDTIITLISELHPLKDEFLPNLDVKGEQYNEKKVSASDFDFKIITKCLNKLAFTILDKLGYTWDEYENHNVITEFLYESL